MTPQLKAWRSTIAKTRNEPVHLGEAIEAVRSAHRFESTWEREFFSRVYSTPVETYVRRLRMIGFENLNGVIDAACGYGQWSVALAQINEQVSAFDVDIDRVRVTRKIAAHGARNNVAGAQASLDSVPYRDESVDAIFCYGAIFAADFRRAVEDFHRVLRPGGRLYFMACDLGWFVHTMATGHKSAVDLSKRREALRGVLASLSYYILKKPPSGTAMVIPTAVARRALRTQGFHSIEIAGEGCLGTSDAKATPFFRSRYFGFRGVYEVLATK